MQLPVNMRKVSALTTFLLSPTAVRKVFGCENKELVMDLRDGCGIILNQKDFSVLKRKEKRKRRQL